MLSFLSTEEGGRKTEAFSGYRPNHNFGEPSVREFYVGQITFPLNESIKPGQSKEVDIEFLNGPGLMRCDPENPGGFKKGLNSLPRQH
jgi:translation elongation factor EF-Tu-like GTPase